jgi:hypothetical protein
MAISLPIVTKYDDKGIKQAELSIGGFQGIALGIFAKIGASAVEAFARASQAAFDFGVDAVKAASSFQETSAAIGEVFGTSSKELQEFAKTASSSIGQSQVQFLQGAKTFGIFGKAAGLGEKANANFATTLNSLASDMASFNDTTIDDAIQALGAALRGESEPIRRYGVLLDDATLRARALSMGIYDGTGSLTQQQRVLAAYEEILAQTVTQQGDFTRTSDGLANSSRTLESVFENLQISVGTALLPALEAAVPQLTAFIEEMVADPEFQQFIADLGTNFGTMLGYLPGVLDTLGQFGEDALPAINAFFPMLNDALYGVAAAFGFIETSDPTTNTKSFAGAMQDLADAMDAVGESFRWIGDSISWLNSTYDKLPGWMKLVLGGGTSRGFQQLTGFIDAFQTGNMGAIRSFLGVPNLSGVPGSVTNVPLGGGRNIKIPGQAEGGITSRSGLSWVGEKGPELLNLPRGAQVIPLDRMGSGSSINITVNAGMGTDGAAVGEQIVNAIRRYERTSGAVFARA